MSKDSIHDSDEYLRLVKHFICIGHIHNHTVYNRIIAQGSFDRLNHGEEEPKGAVLCTISKNGNSFEFIENKQAKIYKTIKIRFNDLDRALQQIENNLSKIPEGSYVRIQCKKDHPLYIAFDELKIKYPLYFFTKDSVEDKEEILTDSEIDSDDYVPITITSDNVVSLIVNEVRSKHQLSEKQLQSLTNILENNNV